MKFPVNDIITYYLKSFVTQIQNDQSYQVVDHKPDLM